MKVEPIWNRILNTKNCLVYTEIVACRVAYNIFINICCHHRLLSSIMTVLWFFGRIILWPSFKFQLNHTFVGGTNSQVSALWLYKKRACSKAEMPMWFSLVHLRINPLNPVSYDRLEEKLRMTRFSIRNCISFRAYYKKTLTNSLSGKTIKKKKLFLEDQSTHCHLAQLRRIKTLVTYNICPLQQFAFWLLCYQIQ